MTHRRMSLARAREANRRRQRLIADVQEMHRLGERVVFEAFDEIARETGRRPVVERIASEFAGINPDHLQVVGGNHFPQAPLRIVGKE